jgi:transposase-like protein
MEKNSTRSLTNVIRIDDERIQDHLGKIVRGSVEDTLNALLEAEAERLVGAGRHERTEARRATTRPLPLRSAKPISTMVSIEACCRP